MSTERKENVAFYTIAEFKTMNGIPDSEKAQVVKNPNGDQKLFLSIGSKNFKCQQDITADKEILMLVEDGKLDEACLVNTKPSINNVVFTL